MKTSRKLKLIQRKPSKANKHSADLQQPRQILAPSQKNTSLIIFHSDKLDKTSASSDILSKNVLFIFYKLINVLMFRTGALWIL